VEKEKLLPAVIIPAYNEERVIGKLLESLQSGVENNCFRVVVACNGTRDNSIDYIRNKYPMVTCLDINKASKANAINEAEKINMGFPRIFIDADIVISTSSVEKIIDYINQIDGPAVVAPRGKINTSLSDTLVRSYYSAWTKTIFYLEYGFGSGVYALNKKARSTFECFPEIIADDGFVREVVNHNQFYVCEHAESLVEAPRKVIDLLNIKIRSKLGNAQLINLGLIKNKITEKKRFLSKVGFLNVFVYIVVSYFAKRGAEKKIKDLSEYSWQRDESTRM
jgi:glycosyltransferase involved in cell wall biosynthesis